MGSTASVGPNSNKSPYLDDDGYTKLVNTTQLKEGDHIAYPLSGHIHHAIVVKHDVESDKTTVIHLLRDREITDSPIVPGKVVEEEVDLRDFTLHRKLLVYNYGRNHCFQVNKVIATAKAKLGPASYDVENYNSEHFARECKYGTKESSNVTFVIKIQRTVEVPAKHEAPKEAPKKESLMTRAVGLAVDTAAAYFGLSQ